MTLLKNRPTSGATTMTLKDVAEIQSVYSLLFLDGLVSDETYRAVVNATMLELNGMNDVRLGIIAEDMRSIDKVKTHMDKIMEKK